MKILLLGPQKNDIINFLKSSEDDVETTEEALTSTAINLEKIDFIISYGYRHILTKDILARFPKRAINLHISLVPWNKGADPNLWSFLEDSPKGVTIHYLSEGIDTGDIIVQEEVDYKIDDTLRTSYGRLTERIEYLFKREWPKIRAGKMKGTPQQRGGTFHRLKDKEKYSHLLKNGWDTPVLDLKGKALE